MCTNADRLYAMHIPYILMYLLEAVASPLCDYVCVSRFNWNGSGFIIRFNISLYRVELQTKRWNVPSKYSCNFCNVINKGMEQNEMKRAKTKTTEKEKKRRQKKEQIGSDFIIFIVGFQYNDEWTRTSLATKDYETLSHFHFSCSSSSSFPSSRSISLSHR